MINAVSFFNIDLDTIFRYIITLTYKDVVTGQEETFRGGANSPGEIIQGTAKRFSIFVSEMIAMPVGAYCYLNVTQHRLI